MTWHDITLHSLHYITLHYITLYYITIQYNTIHTLHTYILNYIYAWYIYIYINIYIYAWYIYMYVYIYIFNNNNNNSNQNNNIHIYISHHIIIVFTTSYKPIQCPIWFHEPTWDPTWHDGDKLVFKNPWMLQSYPLHQPYVLFHQEKCA